MTPAERNRFQDGIDALREIVRRDYGVALTDEQAMDLGLSLLRLTRVALAASARALNAKGAG
jgi:hypothetical protein